LAISIPWTSSERDGDDAGDPTPIRHARFSDDVSGARYRWPPLARLIDLADSRRPIPASTEASTDRAGGYLVVLADGWR